MRRLRYKGVQYFWGLESGQSQTLGLQPPSKTDAAGPHGCPGPLQQTHTVAPKHRLKQVKHLGIFCPLACVALLLETSSPEAISPSVSKANPNKINRHIFPDLGYRTKWLSEVGPDEANILLSEGIASEGDGDRT